MMEVHESRSRVTNTLIHLNNALTDVGYIYVTPLLDGVLLNDYTRQLNHAGSLELVEVSEDLSTHPLYYLYEDHSGHHTVFVGEVVDTHENGAIVCRNGAVDQILWTNQTSLN